MEGSLPFLLCFTLYLRGISAYKPPRGLIFGGQFDGGCFVLRVWGAYTWRGLFLEFYGMFRLSFTSNEYFLTVDGIVY